MQLRDTHADTKKTTEDNKKRKQAFYWFYVKQIKTNQSFIG